MQKEKNGFLVLLKEKCVERKLFLQPQHGWWFSGEKLHFCSAIKRFHNIHHKWEGCVKRPKLLLISKLSGRKCTPFFSSQQAKFGSQQKTASKLRGNTTMPISCIVMRSYIDTHARHNLGIKWVNYTGTERG